MPRAVDFNLSIGMASDRFFDRELITNRIGAGKRRMLSRFGAYVRTRARSSIRQRKRIATPGSPPSAHTQGPASLRNIQFALGDDNSSVIIGPVKLSGRAAQAALVPQLLEKGGTTQITDRHSGRTRSAYYRKFPYMVPAFQRELQQLRPSLDGSIT